jgi:hypothetical protein
MNRVSVGINRVSAAAVVFIMLLTCADVVMRLFDRPIPGTYELVGYFGAVIVAFAMACTFVERGHISVELLVDRLPARPRAFIEGTGYLLSAVLFGLLAWQSQVYAMDLLESGGFHHRDPDVAFVFSLTAGCGCSRSCFSWMPSQVKRGSHHDAHGSRPLRVCHPDCLMFLKIPGLCMALVGFGVLPSSYPGTRRCSSWPRTSFPSSAPTT